MLKVQRSKGGMERRVNAVAVYKHFGLCDIHKLLARAPGCEDTLRSARIMFATILHPDKILLELMRNASKPEIWAS